MGGSLSARQATSRRRSKAQPIARARRRDGSMMQRVQEWRIGRADVEDHHVGRIRRYVEPASRGKVACRGCSGRQDVGAPYQRAWPGLGGEVRHRYRAASHRSRRRGT